MHPSLIRRPLGGGFDAAAVFADLLDGRDDVFWLDSGRDGISYLGEGTRLELDADRVWATLRAVPGGDHLGVVGWLGYELRAGTTGASVTRRSRYPDAAFLAVDRAIAIDGATGEAELIGEPDDWAQRLPRLAGAVAPAPTIPTALLAVRHESDEQYLANIAACQQAIHDGEAYQLCLTTELAVAGRFDPLEVYLRLRASSATHHGGLIRIGGVGLLSSSPEQFLAVDPAGRVTTRPIKGTRTREPDPRDDAARARELRESEKERAENLMIVDLMRNDLSRVCELGSVVVTELLEVESYPHVHQLVSTIVGQLAEGRTTVDALEACFPAGSMTGAPKRRATEILDGLERRARGLYAGAFGYLGSDGRADLAMTIRTIVLDSEGATVGAGGGITALSVPREELLEMQLKAAALLAALGASEAR